MKKTYEEWLSEDIVCDPNVLGGEPTFKGTRLAVRRIGAVPTGHEMEVLQEYPYLSLQDIEYARRSVQEGP